ncbi:MAG: hypothetical protein ACI8ZW_002431 [Yoonia sp.]|jgi:hypothetical protein
MAVIEMASHRYSNSNLPCAARSHTNHIATSQKSFTVTSHRLMTLLAAQLQPLKSNLTMDTPEQPQPPKIPCSTGRFILYLIFGILLPAFTLGFEIVTGFRDDIYINPIPSVFHVLLIGITPVIIALNVIRCIRKQPIRKWDLHLNSLCLGMTSVYATIYLPIAPFISLLCAYRIRKEMRCRIAQQWPIELRHLFLGFSLGITLLCCGSIPTYHHRLRPSKICPRQHQA